MHVLTEPYFSVIIPAYRAKHFLPIALASLKNQTCQDFEVIIGPDDGDSYQEFSSDKVLVLDRLAVRTGAGKTRNDCVANAIGQYIVMLDADDELPPNYFEAFQSHFRRTGDLCAVAPTEFFNDQGLCVVRGDKTENMNCDTFAWCLASIHTVCHRSIHIPWEGGMAEDVLRDACIIDSIGCVTNLIHTRYRARMHSEQTTAKWDEQLARKTYRSYQDRFPNSHIGELFRIFEAANLLFERFRSRDEDWYAFFQRLEMSRSIVQKTMASWPDSKQSNTSV